VYHTYITPWSEHELYKASQASHAVAISKLSCESGEYWKPATVVFIGKGCRHRLSWSSHIIIVANLAHCVTYVYVICWTQTDVSLLTNSR